MKMRSLLVVASLFSCTAWATTLANDSYDGGTPAAFNAGFVTGEEAAVRLVPPDAGVWQVSRILVLFGGVATTQTVTLNIYDDSALLATPPAPISSSDFQLVGSDSTLQELDIAGNGVFVTGPLRVGLLYQHPGLPTAGNDTNGLTTSRNFIKVSGLGWTAAETVGISGDFIIRADVILIDGGSVPIPDSGTPDAGSPDSGTPDAGSLDGGTPDAGGIVVDSGMPDAGVGPPGFGAPCRVNSECLGGLHCASSICTYECRKDIDCSSGQICTTLGQCEAAPKSGCGCGSVAALPLVLLALALRRVRRRSGGE